MNLAIPYQLENLIGGKFIAPLSKQYIDNINPATAEKVGEIPNSDAGDIEMAVAAATNAFKEWSVLSSEKKFIILK